MSLRTAFLNLFKPEVGDRFSITGTEGYNKNMDLIDAAVKKNAEGITQLNSDMLLIRVFYITAEPHVTSDEIGQCYCYFDITSKIKSDFGEDILDKTCAIIPIGATRINGGGYAGLITPYSWSELSDKNTQWCLITPTVGTYGCTFFIFLKK